MADERTDLIDILRRISRLEDRFDYMTEKIFDRLRGIELRIAAYIGVAAVLVWFLDRLISRP